MFCFILASLSAERTKRERERKKEFPGVAGRARYVDFVIKEKERNRRKKNDDFNSQVR